jgi:hypothetical protein
VATVVAVLVSVRLNAPEVASVELLASVNVPLVVDVTDRPLMVVAVATPREGVTSVGEVDRTTSPDPVDVVTPVPPLATAKAPVTPVESGRPVALVSVTETGVPKFGVISVGEFAKTKDPVPVVDPPVMFVIWPRVFTVKVGTV